MQDLEKSVDAFLKGDNKVAIIKGGWGVGKTYFWDKYIAQRIEAEDLEQIAYSYISFFGKTSLSDVRKSIFHSLKPTNSDTDIKKLFESKFANRNSLLKIAPYVALVTKNVQDIPSIGNFFNMISTVEYSLVDNYVICFDDIERKADKLAIKEIMGLIDELAIRKNCKVILIFNENELAKGTDKTEFYSYREKIVDIELNHEPPYVENIKIAFPDDFKHLSIVENVVNKLDIKNIRVLKKIYQVMEEFDILSNEHPNSLIEEFITHAAVLCWGYFIYKEELSFETIKYQLSQKSWVDYMSDDKREKIVGEERYSVIASNLKLFPSRFDTHITHYLEQGFVNKKELKDAVSDMLKSVEIEQCRVKLEKAWDIYTDSFKDDFAEFIIALEDILKEDMDNLGLYDFSSIINIFEEYGKEPGKSVSYHIKNYIEVNKESLKNTHPGSMDMERIKNEKLKAKIWEIYKENKRPSIDGIAEKIAKHRSYGPEDVDFLSSMDKENFRAWMKKNPKNLIDKIKDGLLIFKNSGDAQSGRTKTDKIYSDVRGALLDIANENALNKKRVKYIYGIE